MKPEMKEADLGIVEGGVKRFGPFDNVKVLNYLPHRQPFLFVDKILEVTCPVDSEGKPQQVGTRVRGVKNATINEPYFTGHFPSMPITPGVILIETMAQVASFGILPFLRASADLRILSPFELRLAGVDNARFRRPFLPGDQIVITCETVRQRGPIWGFRCKGEIEGHLAMECDLLASAVVE